MKTGKIDDALALGPIYEDDTYQYFGEAGAGTALNAPYWRISRVHKITLQVQWANVDKGTANFNNLFTDLPTVAALTYS